MEGKWGPERGRSPSGSQGCWRQNQLDFESPGSMPVLFPLHRTDAIVLRMLFFSSLQEQHAEKSQNVAEILASWNGDGFIRQLSRSLLRLFSSTQLDRALGKIKLRNSLGFHLLIKATVRFSTLWQMIKDFHSLLLSTSYFKTTLGQITRKKMLPSILQWK